MDEPAEPVTSIRLKPVLPPVDGASGESTPLVESYPESMLPVPHERTSPVEGDGLEVPRDFDLAATLGLFSLKRRAHIVAR